MCSERLSGTSLKTALAITYELTGMISLGSSAPAWDAFLCEVTIFLVWTLSALPAIIAHSISKA